MRIGSKLAALAAIFCTLASLRVAIPPLPAPQALVDRPYSALVQELGQPTTVLPDKFAQWSVERLGFVWFIEVSYTQEPNSVPEFVSRQLWVGPKDSAYPLIRQFAQAKPEVTRQHAP